FFGETRLLHAELLGVELYFQLARINEDASVNGSIETSAGQRYGDLETVNGAVRVAENVQARDASTVNGSIHVESGARVDSLETVNGAIR
ncbi:hypothetical protein, partial [Escherichia coli]|uniref:hypothetical protein n=1 Tax=Escherichia coli TaxID=562 RepID=UPI00215B4AFB